MGTEIAIPTVLIVLPLLALLAVLYFKASGWLLDRKVAPLLRRVLQNGYARRLRKLGLNESEIEQKQAEIAQWGQHHHLWPFGPKE